MNDRIAGLIGHIKALEVELQSELEDELARTRKRLLYQIERNRIRFEQEVLAQQLERLRAELSQLPASATDKTSIPPSGGARDGTAG